jgi:hypothetical protein
LMVVLRDAFHPKIDDGLSGFGVDGNGNTSLQTLTRIK